MIISFALLNLVNNDFCAMLAKRNDVPILYGTLFRLSRVWMSDKVKDKAEGLEPPERGDRRVRADAQRNLESLLKTAVEVFSTSGVDAPVREIAEKAGVGIATIYRHFPQRSDLIAAVFRHEIDACADAAPSLATEFQPGEALEKWMQRYAELIATKRGLAPALHSGDPAYENLRTYFEQRLRPALSMLLEAAAASSEIRGDADPDDLLGAVASLCMSAYASPDRTRRMVALLVDGLRFGARP
jgi:AcrR family transcriptional regulator